MKILCRFIEVRSRSIWIVSSCAKPLKQWAGFNWLGNVAHRSQVCVTVCVNRVSCVDLILLQDLTKHLDEVTQNSEIVEIRQKEAECELEAARDRVQQQATEILLKASKTLSFFYFLPSSHMDLYLYCEWILAPTLPTKHILGLSCQHIKTDPLTDPLILSEKSLPLTL